MIEFPRTSLDEVLNSVALNSTKLYFSNTNEPILSRYVYKAIKLGINPILDLLPHGRYCIAGGVFRSLFFGEIPTDVDIYPLHSESIVGDIQQRALKACFSIKLFSGDISKIKAHVDVLTFDKLKDLPYKIQIISKSIEQNNQIIVPKTVDDILSAFDIIPACFGIDITVNSFEHTFDLNEVVIHPDYFYSVSNRLLLVNKENSSLYEKQMTAERFYKYIVNYGFRVPDNNVMSQFNALMKKQINEFEDGGEYV